MGKATSFLCGFLTAGVISSVAVLLSTPKSGKEWRKELKEKWNDAEFSMTEVKVATETLKESVGEFGRKSLPALKQTVRDIQEIITVWREDIKPNLESISGHLKEMKPSEPPSDKK
ncbi:YtxH domain-containing protein [Tuberibacillus calidus]|jgi:gas vesicle protein|uniref:YtxH domain-containing protein n=1 Tax=Tuberibacillus calidus TaxID=340097 RepID=UPI0003FF548C|nr:YtxH domain-containing protein [Tuberibacillus calidus]